MALTTSITFLPMSLLVTIASCFWILFRTLVLVGKSVFVMQRMFDWEGSELNKFINVDAGAIEEVGFIEGSGRGI